MLTIKPQTDYKKITQSLDMNVPDNAFVMVMKDGEEVLGAGAMLLCDDYCIVLDIRIREELADFSLEFGMGKALLNAADLAGAHHAVTDIPCRERLFTALRFKNSSSLGDNVPDKLRNFEKYVCLEGYFTDNCTNCIKE